MKTTKKTGLHEELREAIVRLRAITNQMLNTNARLSTRDMRGHMCRVCRRPTAKLDVTTTAGFRDGDGPDLCWGYCDKDHD